MQNQLQQLVREKAAWEHAQRMTTMPKSSRNSRSSSRAPSTDSRNDGGRRSEEDRRSSAQVEDRRRSSELERRNSKLQEEKARLQRKLQVMAEDFVRRDSSTDPATLRRRRDRQLLSAARTAPSSLQPSSLPRSKLPGWKSSPEPEQGRQSPVTPLESDHDIYLPNPDGNLSPDDFGMGAIMASLAVETHAQKETDTVSAQEAAKPCATCNKRSKKRFMFLCGHEYGVVCGTCARDIKNCPKCDYEITAMLEKRDGQFKLVQRMHDRVNKDEP